MNIDTQHHPRDRLRSEPGRLDGHVHSHSSASPARLRESTFTLPMHEHDRTSNSDQTIGLAATPLCHDAARHTGGDALASRHEDTSIERADLEISPGQYDHADTSQYVDRHRNSDKFTRLLCHHHNRQHHERRHAQVVLLMWAVLHHACCMATITDGLPSIGLRSMRSRRGL